MSVSVSVRPVNRLGTCRLQPSEESAPGERVAPPGLPRAPAEQSIWSPACRAVPETKPPNHDCVTGQWSPPSRLYSAHARARSPLLTQYTRACTLGSGPGLPREGVRSAKCKWVLSPMPPPGSTGICRLHHTSRAPEWCRAPCGHGAADSLPGQHRVCPRLRANPAAGIQHGAEAKHHPRASLGTMPGRGGHP